MLGIMILSGCHNIPGYHPTLSYAVLVYYSHVIQISIFGIMILTGCHNILYLGINSTAPHYHMQGTGL